jgi:hypothetical protein
MNANRMPSPYEGVKESKIRNRKKKQKFDGEFVDTIKPKHKPYHRCPTNLHNYLLDDDDIELEEPWEFIP